MATYQGHPGLAKPIPVHALQPSSVAGVEAIIRYAARRKAERFMGTIVTDVGRPSGTTAAEPMVVPRNAHLLHDRAAVAGFEARLDVLDDAVMVQGRRDEPWEGFTVVWPRSGGPSALWHAPWRYEMVDDDRRIGVSATTRVSLAGHRAAGVGPHRLSLVACPSGMPIGYSEVMRRVQGLS